MSEDRNVMDNRFELARNAHGDPRMNIRVKKHPCCWCAHSENSLTDEPCATCKHGGVNISQS